MLGIKPKKKNQFKSKTKARVNRIRWIFSACARTLSLIVLMSMMSLTFILAHDLLTQCDMFKAENIRVTGQQRLTVEEILKHAGVHAQTNIFSVNLKLARQRLISHPWIAEADIRRKLPGSLRIRVVEHIPLAILDLGRKFVLNTKGDVFKEWSESDPDNLPIISGLAFSDLKLPQESPVLSYQAVMAVLTLGQKNGCVLPNHRIDVIHVDRESGLTLSALNPVKTIRLGYHNYPLKYDIISKILHYLKNQRMFSEFQTIDLNNPNRIVVYPIKPDLPESDQKEV